MTKKMVSSDLKTEEIEIAVSKYFGIRQNIIIPNVYWSFYTYEIDLLVLTRDGYAYEIEIKVSKQDIIQDIKKKHNHDSKKIKYVFFAIPNYLINCAEHIPDKFGILTVERRINYQNKVDYSVKKKRNPELQNKYKYSQEERYGLLRLGYMRYWTLRKRSR